MNFGIAAIIIIVGYIVYLIVKANQEDVYFSALDDIKNQYKSLNVLVIDSYELNLCSRCLESRMEVLNVSPTGQSVEYRCMNCSKKAIGKLLPSKDGSKAVYLYNKIKRDSEEYKGPMTTIDVSFIVKASINNSNESKQRVIIPEAVRHEVWRRDQGRCVQCNGQVNLEFDHIIPVSKGGSSTARNLQLLCETGNRSKSAKI